MKTFGTLLILVALGLLGSLIADDVFEGYCWDRDCYSYWEMADRASTLAKKSEYLDKFMAALDAQNLGGSHANLFLNTPRTQYDFNRDALGSLQSRMHATAAMDQNSMAYQMAIQQITGQEWGEADALINTINDCYDSVHFYCLWNPIVPLLWIVGIVAFGFFGIASFIYSVPGVREGSARIYFSKGFES